MRFRTRVGIPLPYEVQGLVCFTCLTYKIQPKSVQETIDRLCAELGGDYARPLFLLLTTLQSVVGLSIRHYCSENTLHKLRRKFYVKWYEEFKNNSKNT